MEEEHLLSLIDVCDNNDMILDTGASMMYMQVDIQEVSELKTSCTSEARLSNERHEDHDDDVEPPMSEDDVEVDYEFHNNGAFVQVELSLEDEDVKEKSLSQIRPTLQALNSPNMWIGDTGQFIFLSISVLRIVSDVRLALYQFPRR